MTEQPLSWVRSLCSLAPLAGLVGRPGRPNGVSAIVRVQGEEEWLEPCLRSIRGFADEIVVLDNGASPETRRILEAVRPALGSLLRVEERPHLDLFAMSNFGLAASRFRWVIRWDADFVAHTSGAGDIRALRQFLLQLDPRRYYLVRVGAVEVAGDLFHQFPDLRVRFDGQAVVWSPAIRYVAVHRTVAAGELATPDRVLRDGRAVSRSLESLRTPPYYKVLTWDRPAYVHVNIKSRRHMLLRHFWLEWLEAVSRGSAETREDYAARRAREDWGIGTWDEAEQAYLQSYCRQLVPFDAERCGPYPELLEPYLKNPGYRLEYRGETVIGRRERRESSHVR